MVSHGSDPSFSRVPVLIHHTVLWGVCNAGLDWGNAQWKGHRCQCCRHLSVLCPWMIICPILRDQNDFKWFGVPSALGWKRFWSPSLVDRKGWPNQLPLSAMGKGAYLFAIADLVWPLNFEVGNSRGPEMVNDVSKFIWPALDRWQGSCIHKPGMATPEFRALT